MAEFDAARFHSVLRTDSFGRNLIFEPVVDSTMDVARDAAAHGAVEGTVVAADEQTAGRGRLGRSWITPPAVNLASTLILRPPRDVLRSVAMIAPLAIVRGVEDVCGLRAGIKWPNDVVVDSSQLTVDRGAVADREVGARKLAGVLIETDIRDDAAVVLVGAGINVNFDARAHEEIRDIATSLKSELGREIDRETLLAAYLMRFEELYVAAKGGASPLAAWKEQLVTLGHRVHASWPGGEADGMAVGVDEDGALLVRVAEEAVVRVEAGDVTLRG
jgi:BirA family biotin operon repressor/biotin-[acetyl-CoA-carboxylase] ligase